MTSEPNKVFEVFFSYAHKDIRLRNELEKHLSILKRQGYIKTWHDRKIVAGKDWEFEINRYLEKANIILLLISPDFLASDYCDSIEVKQALKRHGAGECCVIPIILRPVSWKDASFGKLQALPTSGKAVTEWQNRDKAFLDIAEGIQKVIQEFSSSWVNENSLTLTKQDVNNAWENIIKRTRQKTHGTLAAMLRLCEIVDVEGTAAQPIVVIQSEKQSHYKYVKEEDR
jgi:TIR domain